MLDNIQVRHKPLRKNKPILIFGAGKFAQDLGKILITEKYTVSGFLQTIPNIESLIGLPVYKLSDVSSFYSYQIVIGIFNREVPYSYVLDQLPKFDDIFLPWEIYPQFERTLGWRYWLGNPYDILDNQEYLKNVYDRLEDNISRYCFENICRFRLGLDIEYSHYRNSENQYFNDISLHKFNKRPISYLDAGAYDGDTYIDALSHTGINEAYLFEPNKENYTNLCQTVSNLNKKVMCLPLAIADQEKVISFNSTVGESSSILDAGEDQIATICLDNMLSNVHLDFIKLDVEGAESLALQGMRRIISNQRPVITMSLYHKPKDLFELPTLLLDIENNYKLYIRQHYYNSFDCVLYAVPKS